METILTFDDIISAPDRDLIKLEVPQWGGVVFVKKLSLADMLNVLSKYFGEDGKAPSHDKGYVLDIVSKSVCDEKGRLLFNDEEKIKALASKSWEVIMFLFNNCQSFNFPNKEDVDAIEKN